MDELLGDGDAGEHFHQLALRRAQRDGTQLRDAVGVKDVNAGERSARNHRRARNKNCLMRTGGNFRAAVHAGVQLRAGSEIDLDHEAMAGGIGGGKDLGNDAAGCEAGRAIDVDWQLHAFVNAGERRLIDRGLKLQGTGAFDLQQRHAGRGHGSGIGKARRHHAGEGRIQARITQHGAGAAFLRLSSVALGAQGIQGGGGSFAAASLRPSPAG